MAKQGKIFENLVHAISECLHEKAEVTLDDRLPDKDTGRKRQVDISIRLKDGPTEFLAIVEARNRSRPVGIDYVEQVKTKREAVGADKAIIVSNKGFYKSALEKAKKYGIGAYSLKEALQQDWSLTFKYLDYISVHTIGSNLKIFYLDESNKIINPHSSITEAIKRDGFGAVLAKNEIDEIEVTARKLISLVYHRLNVSELVDTDPDKKHPIKIVVDVAPEVNLYFLDENNGKRKFIKYAVVGDVWRETTEHATKISQYRNEETGEVFAEVVGFKEPDELAFELILENPQADGERKLFFRPNAT